jgi:hypothetical protein
MEFLASEHFDAEVALNAGGLRYFVVALEEAAYLPRSPANARRLLEGPQQARGCP